MPVDDTDKYYSIGKRLGVFTFGIIGSAVGDPQLGSQAGEAADASFELATGKPVPVSKVMAPDHASYSPIAFNANIPKETEIVLGYWEKGTCKGTDKSKECGGKWHVKRTTPLKMTNDIDTASILSDDGAVYVCVTPSNGTPQWMDTKGFDTKANYQFTRYSDIMAKHPEYKE